MSYIYGRGKTIGNYRNSAIQGKKSGRAQKKIVQTLYP
ncbi:MAG: hypothetical protein NPMRth3_1020006, partial [Nitrosopumilales archaeon]